MRGNREVKSWRVSDVEVVDFSPLLNELLSIRNDVPYRVFNVRRSVGDFDARQSLALQGGTNNASWKIKFARKT